MSYEVEDSEEEAYDPWPGCVMTRTGCHYHSLYTREYSLSPALAMFLEISGNAIISYNDIEQSILDYIQQGAPKFPEPIPYDAKLWTLFDLEPEAIIKIYHIPKHIMKHITRVIPRPVIYWGSYIEDLEAIPPLEPPQPSPSPDSAGSRELPRENSGPE